MAINPHTLQMVKTLTWEDVLPAAGVLGMAWLASVLVQWTVGNLRNEFRRAFGFWFCGFFRSRAW